MSDKLTDDQDRALEGISQFLQHPHQQEFVMEGHAGVGKTWLVQRAIKEHARQRWMLTAPTNKASRVLRQMAKATGLSPEVATTYSALGLRLQANGDTRRVEAVGKCKVQDFEVMVVDEGSMVNQNLRRELLSAIEGLPIKVLYVMDPLQLPPVGEPHSAVAGIANKVTMTQIVRQAEGNPIIQTTEMLRQAILEGRMPRFEARKSKQGGIYLLEEAKWMHWMKSGFNSDKYLEDPQSFRTLSWTNRRVGALNHGLRRVLYPEHYRERFVPGERVVAAAPVVDDEQVAMTTDEEATVETVKVMPHPIYGHRFMVYALELVTDEGAIAYASVIHENSMGHYKNELSRRAGEAKKTPSLWGAYWGFVDQFHDLRPCHALTVHRSQGSTFDHTFVDVADVMRNRNFPEALRCLYVAVSRASTNVMLTGV